MPVFRPYDPVPAYMFAVELNGNYVGLFTICTGLGLERDIYELREGGTNDLTYQFPGRVKPGRVTLKRGLMATQQLFDWFNVGILDGKVKRQNVSIVVLSRQVASGEYKVIQRWDLLSCWPIKYEGPELNAESVQPALESVDIAYNGLLCTTDFTAADFSG